MSDVVLKVTSNRDDDLRFYLASERTRIGWAKLIASMIKALVAAFDYDADEFFDEIRKEFDEEEITAIVRGTADPH